MLISIDIIESGYAAMTRHTGLNETTYLKQTYDTHLSGYLCIFCIFNFRQIKMDFRPVCKYSSNYTRRANHYLTKIRRLTKTPRKLAAVWIPKSVKNYESILQFTETAPNCTDTMIWPPAQSYITLNQGWLFASTIQRCSLLENDSELNLYDGHG